MPFKTPRKWQDTLTLAAGDRPVDQLFIFRKVNESTEPPRKAARGNEAEDIRQVARSQASTDRQLNGRIEAQALPSRLDSLSRKWGKSPFHLTAATSFTKNKLPQDGSSSSGQGNLLLDGGLQPLCLRVPLLRIDSRFPVAGKVQGIWRSIAERVIRSSRHDVTP
jgi:hypothetical protein